MIERIAATLDQYRHSPTALELTYGNPTTGAAELVLTARIRDTVQPEPRIVRIRTAAGRHTLYQHPRYHERKQA